MSDKQCGWGGCTRPVDREGFGAAMCAGHWTPVWRTLLSGAESRLADAKATVEVEESNLRTARQAITLGRDDAY